MFLDNEKKKKRAPSSKQGAPASDSGFSFWPLWLTGIFGGDSTNTSKAHAADPGSPCESHHHQPGDGCTHDHSAGGSNHSHAQHDNSSDSGGSSDSSSSSE